MNNQEIMYNAFADEMEKISISLKALGIAGLGAGGAVAVNEGRRRWDASSKELAEQRMENMQKRLQRMNAMHAMKYDT
jgi:hypothetical protein